MIIICPLTEWKISDWKGKEAKSRYVFAADNWSYNIACQRVNETNPPIGEHFYVSMRLMLEVLFESYPNSIPAVIRALLDKVDPAAEVSPVTSKAEAYEAGKMLDEKYDLSFGKKYPPDVLKRVFKVAEEATV